MDEFKNENPYGSNDENEQGREEYSQHSESEQTENNVYSESEAVDESTETNTQPEYTNGYDYSGEQQSSNSYQQNPYQNNNGCTYHSGPNSNPYTQNNYSGYNSYNANQNTSNYNSYNSAPQPPKKTGTGKKVLAVLLAFFVVIASIGIGTAIGRNSSSKPSVTNGEENSTADSAQVVIDETKKSNASTDLDAVKKARDSVVGIVVYDSSGELAGEGSGVVMGASDSGDLTYIITCAHVVSDSSVKSCGILLEDGTVYDAKIVGYDERTDIGVLSIKETGLAKASFGDSTALEVTEEVYAIGNPGGSEYYGSVTNGIVSALDRSLTSKYTMQVIQHTAAISPGNSGGALVNSAGQVIGINSSKIAATDYEGIGFAVPISIAKPVVDNIIKYGYVPNRPKLGISYAAVTNYQAYSMVVHIKGLPKGSVIIASISDDSSLSGGDVQVGDMITSVNGKDLDSSDVLLDVVDNAKVGDKIKLGICRINSRTYEVTTFEVTAELVEDKGSTSSDEEETTQSSHMNPFDDSGSGSGSQSGSWEDFFSQFFGQ